MQNKEIILYCDLANTHRGPIVKAIGQTLLKAGYDVRILAESGIITNDNGFFARWRSNRLDLLTAEFGSCINVIHSLDAEVECNEAAWFAQQNVRRVEFSKWLNNRDPYAILIFNGNFPHQKTFLDLIAERGWSERNIFYEVAWFPQSQYLYFNRQGVNAASSLVAGSYPDLTNVQSKILETWRERYLHARAGQLRSARPRRLVVPLQIDTDTTVALYSPFKSMRAFIAHLETFIPDGWDVVIKTHPKATYSYHLMSSRPDFRYAAEGSIYDHLVEAELVIGINSTVLMEAALMGKEVISFGRGIFSGNDVVRELEPADPFPSDLGDRPYRRDPFFYDMVFRNQVEIAKLQRRDVAHLFTRRPFCDWHPPLHLARQIYTIKAGEGRSMIKIGHSKVSKTASLDVTGEGSILIGDQCEVRHHAVLEVIGRYGGTIKVGDRSVIGICNWLQGSGNITIGDDVIIGPYTCIVSTNHTYDDASIPVAQLPLTTDPIVIEDDVWIGANVTITCGVTIGAHSIIGANSFVNSDIPPYSIAVGSPAKVIKRRQ
jgi:acetyltransferase-like isoleucine patch superfamily enzyme